MQYWSQGGPNVPFILDRSALCRAEGCVCGGAGGRVWDGQWLLTITNIHIFNDLNLNFLMVLFFLSAHLAYR